MDLRDFYISPRLDIIEIPLKGVICASKKTTGGSLNDYELEEELVW